MTQYDPICRRQNSSTPSRTGKLLSKKLFLTLFSVLVVFGLGGYLFEVNAIATKGFQIHDLEKQISQIKNDNEKLQLQMVQLKSTTDLTDKVNGLGMVPADGISYLNANAQVVAQK